VPHRAGCAAAAIDDTAGASDARAGGSTAPSAPRRVIGKDLWAPTARIFPVVYPNAPQCTNGGACDIDAWRFYQGQCTSWVAYRLNQLNGIGFNDYYGGQHWGDASGWATAASNLGIAMNTTPAVGAVAWYDYDHVAYVEQVNSPASIVISEMNYDFKNGFWVHTVTQGQSGWPTDFIRIADR
jgi:surface antigen